MKKDQDDIYNISVNQPLAKLTIRIGVAGHRNIENEEFIRATLKNLYETINNLTDQISKSETANHIYSNEDKIIRFISSLAEGADRLCIDEDLIPFDHEIAAILPFEQSEYAKDFQSKKDSNTNIIKKSTADEFNFYINKLKDHDSQLIELDGNPTERDEAYQQCSKALTDHCDILIAVYDGKNTKNKGTSATVNYAKSQGLPIIHISTIKPDIITMQTSSLYGGISEKINLSDDHLLKELERILLFTDIIKKDSKTLDRFTLYTKEDKLKYQPETKPDFKQSGPISLKKEYPNITSRAFNFFKACLTSSNKVNKLKEQLDFKKINEPNAQLDELKDHASNTSHHFYASFLRADRLSNYYANIHRSTFLLIYLLGALALITAAFALTFKNPKESVEFYDLLGLFFVLLELLFLGTILFLYKKDHNINYHGRWLEYRCLAEFLRPMIYLNRLGKSYQLHDLRNTAYYLGREVIGHKNSDRSWLYIYTQTLVRYIGFSKTTLSDQYKTETKKFINRTWVGEQIHYHVNNSANMQVLASRLSDWSFKLFFCTLAVVIIKLILISIKLSDPNFYTEIHKSVVYIISLCTAIFPILATTAFAIRNHAEFDISAQRSLTMRAFLISQFDNIDASKTDITNEQICEVLQNIAEETINEATEWLEIYEVKEAEPA